MPQLNPGPWFAIFLSSWIIYLTILTSKTNNLLYPNNSTMKNIKKDQPQHWNWPWT